MLGDFVFFAADACFVVLEFSNDWKKDWRTAAPDLGVGLPDQLATACFMF